MTSEERREARFIRRKVKRQKQQRKSYAKYDDFDTVFSYDNLYKAYKKCRRSVSWKASTQKYITQAPLLVNRTWNKLHQNKFKSDGFYEFDLYERGKVRHIRSVTITERVVQRCLCDNALVPVLEKGLIYDNGASQKNKGYHFAIRRLYQHLQEHYRKYGIEGYVLVFDFRKFFDNISHKVCKDSLYIKFSDERLIKLNEYFIDCFGTVGLGLGSQISQIFALSSANRLDHYIKEVLHIRGYGRYMDDGYLIHYSKDYLKRCLDHIKHLCSELGIKLNTNKTQIIKLSHGFTFLKVKFMISSTGKIIKKIYKKSITRQRKKLKKFVKLIQENKISYVDVYTSYQSWRSYAKNFSAFNTIKNMDKLYNQLFIDSVCL